MLFREDRRQAATRGTILFYHGLGASKESQDKELRSLAANGYLAIGVDNVGHGERRYCDFEQRFTSANPNCERDFCQAVWETVAEIPQLVDWLSSNDLVVAGRLGLAGISMGGHIAYGAPLVEQRLRVLTPILGSPHWRHPQSPHQYPQRFYPLALLAQNAGADRNVPPQFAREFYQVLGPYYTGAPERLAYVEFADAGHFMPDPEWTRLWQNVLDWYQRFL